MASVMWRQGQAYSMDGSKDFTTMLTEQIGYEEINGLFARDLAVIYQNMGLNGFKRMKRYQGIKEAKEAEYIRHYMVDYMSVTPMIDVSYTSPSSVPSVKDAINLDHTLCAENIMRLGRLMELALSEKRYCAIHLIECLLDKENHRKVKIERIYKECDYVAWDKTYILQYSQCLHEKFKKMEKEHKLWDDKKKYY